MVEFGRPKVRGDAVTAGAVGRAIAHDLHDGLRQFDGDSMLVDPMKGELRPTDHLGRIAARRDDLLRLDDHALDEEAARPAGRIEDAVGGSDVHRPHVGRDDGLRREILPLLLLQGSATQHLKRDRQNVWTDPQQV